MGRQGGECENTAKSFHFDRVDLLGAMNILSAFWLIITLPFTLIPCVLMCMGPLIKYWRCLNFFVNGGEFGDYTGPLVDDTHAKTHIYALGLTFKLWNLPHYRCGTYQEDLKANLKNTAVPGTGLPLSIWAYSPFLTKVFLYFVYPLLNFFISLLESGATFNNRAPFTTLLLHPIDWFTLWRMNCSLASFHSYVTKLEEYSMENKWNFLLAAKNKEFPISEWTTSRGVMIRETSVSSESPAYFRNVTDGGDWIIQEGFENSPFLMSFLPKNAPLSTFRIVTGWKCSGNEESEPVIAFSCVLRAGLASALTDHVSVLYDVDMASGEIKKATTNNHWYRLGLGAIGQRPWTSEHNITFHPDSLEMVSGRKVEEIESLKKLAISAHQELLPGVPLAGWDFALTDKGVRILEVNLSCNFFRGDIDHKLYFSFMSEYFTSLSPGTIGNKKTM